MAFKEVGLTESIPSPYLERYEPAKGRKDVVFICTSKKWITDIHYSEALKTSFHCFDGICCDVIPKKSTYTIYLIAQYIDYKDPNSMLVLKYLRAGRQLDEQIRALIEQYDDPKEVTKLDLTLSLDTTKGEQFKAVKVTPILNNKGGRKASKEALADLKEQLKVFMPNLQQSVAQILTEEQFRTMCEEHGIDLESFESSHTPAPKKTTPKKAKVEEPAEEPELIGEDEIPFGDGTEPTQSFDDDDAVEEVEETSGKDKSTDIAEVEFDLEDLL
jgi:hypothetical protein